MALQQAVEEFRIQTSRLNAGDGTLQVGTTSRPGRPAWHGRIYENLRNDLLDANPHQIVQRGGDKRKLRRNQFGFNITGPVYLPKIYNGTGKTFFTLSFEGMRESIGQFNLNTIPTTRERTGKWSHVVDIAGNPLPIFDPLTTYANPDYDPSQPVTRDNVVYQRLQFPDNEIPVSRLDPVALAALKYYPQPNTNAGPFYRNNYYAVTQQVNKATGFIATVDHTFLDRHRLTVRLSRSVGLNGNAAIFPTLANPANPPTNFISRALRVEHIFTASPTNINTLSFQADSQVTSNDTPPVPETGKVFPRYQIDGYQNMGTQNAISRVAQNNFQLQDTFATRWRNHRLSIGTQLTLNEINTFQPQYPEGRFQFTAGYTSLPGVINTGHAFASFLLGAASYAEQTIVISPSYFRWNRNRFIFNDQWQVTPSLTLTLGANFEVYTQRREKYDRQSNISFAEINPENGRPGALVVAGQGGYGRTFTPLWAKVEPSIGIAWSVLGDNNTVLRLNYQRRYGNPRQNSFQFGTQAFNGRPVWLSPNQQLEPAVLLRDGLPQRIYPDTRPEAANGTTANLIDNSHRQPTSQNFNVSIQRQLAPLLILTATYQYQYGRNQFVGYRAANPNAVPLSALVFRDKLNDLTFANNLRPYPQYQDFQVANFWPGGHQLNKSFSVQLEKRTSGGLALSFSYNYNYSLDDYSDGIQNVYNLRSEWARSANQNPHYAQLTYIYELPFGPGKQFFNYTDWRRHLIGGWAVSGVTRIFSGNPLTMQAQFNNTGNVVNNLRADVVPGVDPHVKHQGPALWFNPAAFVQPDNFSIGNSQRTYASILAPGGYNHDLTVNKRFTAGGDRTVEFIASMFNATNHANWNNPDTRIGPADAPNANAGKIIGSTGGRIVQLGLRLNF